MTTYTLVGSRDLFCDIYLFFASRLGNPKVWWILRPYLYLKRIHYTGPVWIGPGSEIIRGGNLHIEGPCLLGTRTILHCHAPVRIGRGFLGASGLTINSGTHDPTTLDVVHKEVIIGAGVWCGMNVSIIAGSRIGDHSILAAGAVVVGSVPPRVVYGGVPAKKIGDVHRERETPWNPFH